MKLIIRIIRLFILMTEMTEFLTETGVVLHLVLESEFDETDLAGHLLVLFLECFILSPQPLEFCCQFVIEWSRGRGGGGGRTGVRDGRSGDGSAGGVGRRGGRGRGGGG